MAALPESEPAPFVILSENTGPSSGLSSYPQYWYIVGVLIFPQKKWNVADLSKKGMYSKDVG